MAEIVIIYTSETGMTKQYAKWISKELDSDCLVLEEVKAEEFLHADLIVFGAGIRAGRMCKLKSFHSKMNKSGWSGPVVYFATGGAPYDEQTVRAIVANSFHSSEAYSVPFHYFESGLNFEKMKIRSRAIMRVYKMIMDGKKEKSEAAMGTRQALNGSYDHSSPDYIRPLIKDVHKRINV